MTRSFLHSFEPATASPVAGPTVDLDVSDIEDAGIREVLQTPGAAYGAWSILDALLTPTGTGTPFIFREPLGQAREVKVALSGLFGRFVARANLERYFNLSIFAHLGSRTIDLDRRRQVKIQRLSRGDLPDWIARARALVDTAPVRDMEKASAMGGLVGGIVTRAGPITDAAVNPADQETLSRLNLRPVFVGVERDRIRAAIDAEAQAVRSRLADTASPDEFARPDRAGGWIIPLGEERRIIGGT